MDTLSYFQTQGYANIDISRQLSFKKTNKKQDEEKESR